MQRLRKGLEKAYLKVEKLNMEEEMTAMDVDVTRH